MTIKKLINVTTGVCLICALPLTPSAGVLDDIGRGIDNGWNEVREEAERAARRAAKVAEKKLDNVRKQIEKEICEAGKESAISYCEASGLDRTTCTVMVKVTAPKCRK